MECSVRFEDYARRTAPGRNARPIRADSERLPYARRDERLQDSRQAGIQVPEARGGVLLLQVGARADASYCAKRGEEGGRDPPLPPRPGGPPRSGGTLRGQ